MTDEAVGKWARYTDAALERLLGSLETERGVLLPEVVAEIRVEIARRGRLG